MPNSTRDIDDSTGDVQGVVAIRDNLREAILNGTLKPDSVATQMQLADELGVSRTPLREALRMLELEGLIVRQTNRRFRVAGISTDDLEELYVMRMTLEVAALRLTVPSFTVADHAEMEGLLAQIDRFASVSDWDALEVPHRMFHQRLVDDAGPRIAEQLRVLWDHAVRYRRTYAVIMSSERYGDHDVRQAEHRAILDAVEERDVGAASTWLASHYARTALAIADHVDPQNPMDRLRTTLEALSGSRDLQRVRPRGGRAAATAAATRRSRGVGR